MTFSHSFLIRARFIFFIFAQFEEYFLYIQPP